MCIAEVSRAYVVRGASGDECGELIGGEGYNRPTRLQCRKSPTRDLSFIIIPPVNTSHRHAWPNKQPCILYVKFPSSLKMAGRTNSDRHAMQQKITIIVFFPYGSKKLFEVGGCTVQHKLEGQKRWDFSLRHQTRCATHKPRVERGFWRGLERT